MKIFRFCVTALALIAIVTGSIDFIVGLSAQALIGAELAPNYYRDPLLNSQVRYLGCIWMGFGFFLMACLRNLDRNFVMLRWGLAIVSLGGVGRLISLFQFGFPSSLVGVGFIVFALAVEIIAIPIIIFMSNSYDRKPG